MYRVKITLPATITDLGPGLNSLGLAVGLHTTVEISQRSDDQLVVETEGEGAGHYPTGLRHPVMLAAARVFQQEERAALGIHVRVNNQIPLNCGLGAEAAFWVAGVIGAGNLLGIIHRRAEVIEVASRTSRMVSQTVTSMMGGLTASFLQDDRLVSRALNVAPVSVIIALPEVKGYAREIARVKPERVPLQDALFNLSRVPLLVEALQVGDLELIGRLLDDRLHIPYLKPHIAGYDHVVEMARRAGAAAVTLSGDGPAMVAFAESNHRMIAAAMELAFENVGIHARTWIVPVDTQGVVISVSG
ncbi:MAG: hypothetical protein JNM70_18770 [Anaerolineae bacterium]|nr:hypothetical protein [Anaerolineae bacterium]